MTPIRKTPLSTPLRVLLLFSMLLCCGTHAFAMTGTGSSEDPYIITDVTDLQAIRNDPAAYYELGSNIDCSSDTAFEIIGQTVGGAFSGHFDGKGFVISNLTISSGLLTDASTTEYVGLFGYVSGAAIQDVTFSNLRVTGRGANFNNYLYVGGLCGYARDTSMMGT